MASEVKLQAVLTLKDQMTGKLQGARTKMNEVGKTAALLGAAVVAGIGVKAVKAAVEFETAMTDVSTLIKGDSTKAVDEFSTGIKKMMKTIPVNAEQLGASAYSIVSAGISDTSEALDTLEASAKLAVAGLGTTEQATDLVTSAINAFDLGADNAAAISNTFFQTVAAGKTTVSELATSFGASAPIIAAAGIGLSDFSAATAALTTTGLPASQAQMGLRQAIVSLQKPTGEMSELFKKLGVKDGQELIRTSENMGDVFAKLQGQTDGNNETWAKAIGSAEALTVVTGLLGGQGEIYGDTLDRMLSGTNDVDEAFIKQSESTKNQYELLKNNFNVVLMELGNKLLPVLVDLMPKITQFVDDAMGGWHELTLIFDDVTTAIANVIIWFDNLWTTVSEVWGNITGFFSDIGDKIQNIPVIGNLFGGGKAEGGPVSGGTPYVVGEKGPELFVPRGSGNIVPNDQMGGTTNINFNNPVVRNDSDLDSIINAVQQELDRNLSVQQMGI